MTWTIYYDGTAMFKGLSFDMVETLTNHIDSLAENNNGFGWLDLDSPAGDGITTMRLRITPSTAIVFEPTR
ncbi:hypothetical protein Q9R20_14515 [Microbacterium sp. PRF11]|uniref:hypothetical protein n=1 Tax=Microbacterium sp. PRF11 TaxID=2962593 RepID=UPI002882545A|nr:hypothetical protein [Microbacterium sp. PRF11]MDT0118193.1 hypothetical protein [Microbacterium sp. PRF11]